MLHQVLHAVGFAHDQAIIDPLLLQSSSVIKAVHLVEGSIENRNLNVYYSHVAILELRSVNIFDKQQSLQYSDRITTFLSQLAQDLRLRIIALVNVYSHFTGDYSVD
ncbi:unnamed protein product [Didymodactylos carnosus]|uniref:Uncharacterized protein n=1 Tax=Didymodactylos carnosus TaxID=1234261 RepID=A0A815NXU6_9BILA|nr:unnamed protein product [Didymodactylos carnosus]CAF4313979.1 unnamed protein product [Didymodactylos carnosus]